LVPGAQVDRPEIVRDIRAVSIIGTLAALSVFIRICAPMHSFQQVMKAKSATGTSPGRASAMKTRRSWKIVEAPSTRVAIRRSSFLA
jgi:hypothetical protein